MRDYGKVYSTFWSSETTGSMSDDGKLLALYLMTCSHSTIAGVFRLPDGYIAEDLGWDPERVREGFGELLAKGFADRCGTTKWVWIRKHLEWNKPDNPNQRKAAVKVAMSVPRDCGWGPDFMRVCGPLLELDPRDDWNPSATVAEPLPNQKQKQKQKLEQQLEQKAVATGSTVPDAPPASDIAQQSLIESPAGSTAVPVQSRARRTPDTALDSKPSVSTWQAYAVAYQRRYREEPVRNAKVNGQMANFVSRVPADEAPHIATFYVGLADPFYVRQMHAVDYLVRDAEKLRTQWATSRRDDAGQHPAPDFATKQRNAEAKRLLGFALVDGGTVIEG